MLKNTIHVCRVSFLSCLCAIVRLCVTFQNNEIFVNAKAMESENRQIQADLHIACRLREDLR